MKKAVFIVVLLSLAVGITADEISFSGFVLSYMMPDLSDLSNDFSSAGLSTIDDEIVTFGYGSWGGFKNVVFGLWGYGREGKYDGPDASTRMFYSGIYAEPGYFLNIYKGFGVMPGVSIGASKIKLKLRESNLGDTDFDDLLAEPTRTSKVKYRTFTVAPTLTINIPIEFLILSLRGGYQWSPFQGNWKLKDGANLVNPPDINISGPFASVCLMFGDVAKINF